MAGPVIQVRATHFDNADIVHIQRLLTRMTILEIDEPNKKEFSFKKGKTLGLKLANLSCPFLYNIDYMEENDHLQTQDYAKLKHKPVAFINIAALCNGADDHYLLACIALEINKIVGGYIHLLGQIVAPLLKDNYGKFIMLTHQDEMNYVQAIKGEIHEIHYEIEAGGRVCYSHLVNAEWLQNWMNHADFRLIK